MIEVPTRTLDDEIEALETIKQDVLIGKSSRRLQLNAMIDVLKWIRNGGTRPSEFF